MSTRHFLPTENFPPALAAERIRASLKNGNWSKAITITGTIWILILHFLYERLTLMYRLLAPNGTLYLHLDWHADAYARLILDEIFGADHFLNEIIWTYHGPSPIRRAFNRKHDTILAYAKGKDYTFNADAVREPYNPEYRRNLQVIAQSGVWQSSRP